MVTIWVPEIAVRPGPRYLAIADAISEDLDHGRLKPGSRLPTHRDLADRLGVTVGTVSRGYAEAARRGLLSGEVGRGTFVRQWSSQLAVLGSRSPSVGEIDLSVNHPPLSFSQMHRHTLQETLASLARREDLSSLLGYPPDGGTPAHREAGAVWIRRVGLEAPPEQVLVCSGSQHALATRSQRGAARSRSMRSSHNAEKAAVATCNDGQALPAASTPRSRSKLAGAAMPPARSGTAVGHK